MRVTQESAAYSLNAGRIKSGAAIRQAASVLKAVNESGMAPQQRIMDGQGLQVRKRAQHCTQLSFMVKSESAALQAKAA